MAGDSSAKCFFCFLFSGTGRYYNNQQDTGKDLFWSIGIWYGGIQKRIVEIVCKC